MRNVKLNCGLIHKPVKVSNTTLQGPPDKKMTEQPKSDEGFQDPLKVYDKNKDEINLRDLLQKTTATFLVCGGPSTADLDLTLLNQRGIWSMAVNNVGGWSESNFRPSSFVCADPPKKFHHGIWLDPTIMKFIPKPKLSKGRGSLRIKTDEGEFKKAGYSTCHCPNTWGFERRSWMMPDDTFFADEGAAWGNLNSGVRRTKEIMEEQGINSDGQPKTVCTMLLAIRLLYYLGSRRIYLLGVDFNMALGYSFPQERSEGAIQSNNNQFKIVNEWLCEMVREGVFDRFGLEIFNCNPSSGLRAFPHVPFEKAVEDCLSEFPSTPFDLSEWYSK